MTKRQKRSKDDYTCINNRIIANYLNVIQSAFEFGNIDRSLKKVASNTFLCIENNLALIVDYADDDLPL